MAYQLFRTWVLKGRQKLSKLEQHLVISYTKGPKDPKCIYYLTEALRPALAEWLDKNLPPLVERMVAAEIARIVGKKA